MLFLSGTIDEECLQQCSLHYGILRGLVQLRVGIFQSLLMLYMADTCNGGGQRVF